MESKYLFAEREGFFLRCRCEIDLKVDGEPCELMAW